MNKLKRFVLKNPNKQTRGVMIQTNTANTVKLNDISYINNKNIYTLGWVNHLIQTKDRYINVCQMTPDST